MKFFYNLEAAGPFFWLLFAMFEAVLVFVVEQ